MRFVLSSNSFVWAPDLVLPAVSHCNSFLKEDPRPPPLCGDAGRKRARNDPESSEPDGEHPQLQLSARASQLTGASGHWGQHTANRCVCTPIVYEAVRGPQGINSRLSVTEWLHQFYYYFYYYYFQSTHFLALLLLRAAYFNVKTSINIRCVVLVHS